LSFLRYAGIIGGLKEGLRGIINILQLRFSVRVRRATRKAKAVIVANSTGERDFIKIHKVKPIRILDVGIEKIFNEYKKKDEETKKSRILWSGVFQHRKALHILLLALAKMPVDVNYVLRVLGDGPLRKRWRRLSLKLKIDQNCQWLGWLPHQEALLQYQWADVFVLTSLRDACGTVVLEAIRHGVPVLCFDHQGAGDVITEKCGIKINIAKVNDAIYELSDNLMNDAKNRTLLIELSKGLVLKPKNICGQRTVG